MGGGSSKNQYFTGFHVLLSVATLTLVGSATTVYSNGVSNAGTISRTGGTSTDSLRLRCASCCCPRPTRRQ